MGEPANKDKYDGWGSREKAKRIFPQESFQTMAYKLEFGASKETSVNSERWWFTEESEKFKGLKKEKKNSRKQMKNFEKTNEIEKEHDLFVHFLMIDI